MMQISKTTFEKFKHNNKHLRYGQAVHQFLKLEKITGAEKGFCDKLYYEPDDAKAKAMILSRVAHDQ